MGSFDALDLIFFRELDPQSTRSIPSVPCARGAGPRCFRSGYQRTETQVCCQIHTRRACPPSQSLRVRANRPCVQTGSRANPNPNPNPTPTPTPTPTFFKISLAFQRACKRGVRCCTYDGNQPWEPLMSPSHHPPSGV